MIEVVQFVLGLFLGSFYLFLGAFVAYNLLKKVIPGLFRVTKTISLFGKSIRLDNWMVTLPASFLVGVMLITWLTYFGALALNHLEKPLLFGNIISMGIFGLAALFIVIKNKGSFKDFFKKVSSLSYADVRAFTSRNSWELGFILISFIIVTFFMFLTLRVNGNVMTIGGTVHSDFGPHMSMIRSFSEGSNFPTQYPHFPDGHVRYHFLFQFLAGNLEFLGMRIDFAFNVPSILSLISFLMLLYSFVVMVMGAKGVGFITAFLFAFRSSFADFTFITDKLRGKTSITNILKTLWDNVSGHIGRSSPQETWGLYAQNVYVNQRHLAFSLGIMVLILIAVFPMFRSMLGALRKVKFNTDEQIKSMKAEVVENLQGEEQENYSTEIPQTSNLNSDVSYNKLYFRNWIKEFLLSKDAWLPKDMKRSIAIGLILGLMTFWNGAVTIATLPILCIIAIMSKRRLEFLNIAVITVLLSIIEQNIFMGVGQSAVKPELYIGFLANIPPDIMSSFYQYRDAHNYIELIRVIFKMAPSVIQYFIELLGIMPYLMIIAVFSIPKGFARWISLTIITILIGCSILVFPDVDNVFKGFTIILMVVTLLIANTVMDHPVTPKGGRWLALAFLTPWLIATTLKLSPDVPVNHKYIMITSILFDIIMANFLYRMFIKKGVFLKAIVCLLVFTLTFTGFIDLKTLFNMNYYQNVKYMVDDPITKWVKESTNPKAVFLTTADVLDPVLLAGRPVFYGHPYYAWSAGYDTNSRENILKTIYSCKDAQELRKLVKDNNISYILVDDGFRNDENAKQLSEQFISSVFKKVWETAENNTAVYKVE
ncbi:MAG: hypothetical protein Q8942_00745 [Bacillota bacterium]|nr:hypothetical protein [Bacillota bacterium]